MCARLQVNDFILISDSAYTREQILKMEKAILNMLEWNLTVPTPYVFLVRFAKAASSSDHKNNKEVKEELHTFTYADCLCIAALFAPSLSESHIHYYSNSLTIP